MSEIDERAKQLEDQLGAELTKERTLRGVKIKAFENALLINIPGAGVYCLPEATVAEKFRSTPA